jgi:uracil-DNA glycosylase
MIVGESWGEDEEAAKLPFVGKSGALLDQLLTSAGMPREQCYVTNVCAARPPANKVEEWWTDKAAVAKRNGLAWRHGDYYMHEHVVEGLASLPGEISAAQPECVVALGNLAMWALTGAVGIANWRGSELWYEGVPRPHRWDHAFKRKTVEGVKEPAQFIATERILGPRIPVIPTYHPAYVLRVWEWKAAVTRDLRTRVVGKLGRPEARQEPAYQFAHQPSYIHAMDQLGVLLEVANAGPLEIVPDLETRRGRIACVGLAWSHIHSLCVPFMHVDGRRYWEPEQEVELAGRIRALLTHPNAVVCNQNFNYDRQYLVRDPVFGFRAPCHWDTMVAQHLYWPGTPKDLAYLASLYCPWYRFWKEEGKEIEGDADEERWWWYCCLDCVNTYTVWQAQKGLLKHAGLA